MVSEVRFKCCICGHNQTIARFSQHREMADCAGCGSGPRSRALIYAVLKTIYGDATTDLRSQDARKHIRGIGMSDGEQLSSLLSEKLDYQNTLFHADPFLDVCDKASTVRYSDLSFVICSEVLEHTRQTPVEILPNIRQMLLPGGVLILTTPTVHMPNTIEWYGGAETVAVEKSGESFVVRWRNRRGVEYVDTNPSFHGGPGETLEMRVFSHSELISAGERSGFKVSVIDFDPSRGYGWPHLWQQDIFSNIDGRVYLMERSA